LVCTAGTTDDVDGDTVTEKFNWLVNGVQIGVTTSTLSGVAFDRGERVRCRVTPNDGLIDGIGVLSNEVMISNSVPVATSVSISPDPADADDILICGYTFDDDDGDADSGTVIKWTVVSSTSTNSYTVDRLGGVFNRGDSVPVRLRQKMVWTLG
jgi:hypothetical protein